MGRWGAGLSSSDMFMDAYDEFYEKYIGGSNKDSILDSIYQQLSQAENSVDRIDLIAALLKCSWEVGSLKTKQYQEQLSKEMSKLTEEVWLQLDGDRSDFKKFLKNISKLEEKSKTDRLPKNQRNLNYIIQNFRQEIS